MRNVGQRQARSRVELWQDWGGKIYLKFFAKKHICELIRVQFPNGGLYEETFQVKLVRYETPYIFCPIYFFGKPTIYEDIWGKRQKRVVVVKIYSQCCSSQAVGDMEKFFG